MPWSTELSPGPEALVRELYAREQIRQVKWKNLRCLDTKRWDEMATTYHPDCTTSWLDGRLVLEGRDAIMAFLRKTPFARTVDPWVTVHAAECIEIDFVTSEHARSVSRLYNPMWSPDADLSLRLLAFYHDEFRLLDGKWLISHTGHEYILDEAFGWKDVPSHRTQYHHPYDGRRAEEHR
jgi:hypothetical protein